MSTKKMLGQEFDLAVFEGLMSPEDVMSCIRIVLSRFNFDNVNTGYIATCVNVAIQKARATWGPGRSYSFKTHLMNMVEWGIKAALRKSEARVEGQVRIPKKHRGSYSIVPLDKSFDEDESDGSHERIADTNTQSVYRPDVRVQMWELIEQVATLKGLLRCILSSNSQRNTDIFESYYGLRGELPLGYTDIGKRLGLTGSGIRLMIHRLWIKLQMIGSPIKTDLELRNILSRIADFEEVLCEPIRFPITNPSPLRISEIHRILQEREKARENAHEKTSPYTQLDLSFPPIICKGRRVTVTLNVCRAFSLLPDTLWRSYPGNARHTARHTCARYLLAYIFLRLGGDRDLLTYSGFMKKRTVKDACKTIERVMRRPTSVEATVVAHLTHKCYSALRASKQLSNESTETA